MKLVVYIPKNEVSFIDRGDILTAYRQNNQDKTWEAKVVNISPSSKHNSQKNKVELLVENKGNLNPGMYMTLKFLKNKKNTQVLSLDQKAVYDFYDKSVVYLVDKNNQIKREKIDILRQNKDKVYLKNDLSQDDKILISGGKNVQEGDKVEIVN